MTYDEAIRMFVGYTRIMDAIRAHVLRLERERDEARIGWYRAGVDETLSIVITESFLDASPVARRLCAEVVEKTLARIRSLTPPPPPKEES